METELSPIEVVLWDVFAERARQDEKWGTQHHSDAWWLVIEMEELGEVAREVYELSGGPDTSGRLRRLREELVQVAAVCIAWLEDIDSRGD